MRNSWSDEETLEEQRWDEQPRGRADHSSVDAQYEDHAVPEPTWDEGEAS